MNIMQYQRKIQEIGRSYLVTLPKAWCKNYGLGSGEEVLLFVGANGELTVRVKDDKTNQAR